MKLTDEQLAFFVAKYGKAPDMSDLDDYNWWNHSFSGFTLGLSHQQAEVDRLREGNCLDVWICLIPCVPLHFSCWGAPWGMASLDPDDRAKP